MKRSSVIPIPPSTISWRALCQLQPELKVIYDEILGLHDNGESFCANAVWYGYCGWPGFKPRLLRLVGWEVRGCDPRLKTMAAYDMAYAKLYNALPDCRNCGCT